MKHSFSALMVGVAVVLLSFSFSQPAKAATYGSWTWTDLSNSVAYRTNRPVWAVSRAGGYWYYTDGQELWDGGQVYRADHTNASIITLDVRQALSRVDDIVSDGQTVLFLKNVTARNNTFEAVAYNGSYTNITAPLRSYFASDEGIASIKGQYGDWLIVTTKGRVLKGSLFGTFTQLTSSVAVPYSDLAYSSRHSSPADGLSYLPIATAQLGNGWLVAMRDASQNVTRFYRYELYGAGMEVTHLMGRVTHVQAMTGNGNRALIAGIDNANPGTVKVYSTDGITAIDVTLSAAYLPSWNWMRSRVAWDGTSWMILSDKMLARFDGTNFQSLGTTGEYVLSLDGDGQGRFMLGGAQSYSGNVQGPSYPLTATLAVATEPGVSIPQPYVPQPAPQPAPAPMPAPAPEPAPAPTPSAVSSWNNLGITNWEWFDPSATTLAAGQKATYTVQGQTWTGLRRMSVWVNGSLKKVCDFPSPTSARACSWSLYGSNYKAGTKLNVNAKITDSKWRVMWTKPITLTVTAAPVATNNPSATWIWSIPGNDNGVLVGLSNFHLGAWDADGLVRSEVWVNGVMRRVCTHANIVGNIDCAFDVDASEFANGSGVTARGRVVDSLGKETWSDVKTWTVSNTPYTPPYIPPYQYTPTIYPPGTVSITTDHQSGYWPNDYVTFTATANDQNGVEKIEVLVNAVLVKTCYDTTVCSWTGGSYGTRNEVTFGANMIDKAGYRIWTGYKYIVKK